MGMVGNIFRPGKANSIRLPVSNTTTSAGTYFPTLSSALAVHWGVAKVVSLYSGALFRLVRSSDSATLDISPISGGQVPDVSGVSAWLGAATATVDLIYDQTGNGNHLTQTVAIKRPLFDLANAILGAYPITFGASNTTDGLIQTYFDIPAAISVDMRLHTTMLVASAPGPNPNTALFGFGTTGTSFSGAYITVNSSGVKFGAFAPLNATGYLYSQQMNASIPSIAITQASSSSLKSRVDGTSYSFTASAAATYTGGRVGFAYYSSASSGTMQFFGLSLYSASISDADAVLLETANRTIFSIPTSYTKQVIYDGDSISAGYYGKIKLNGLAQKMNLTSSPVAYVVAISGQTAATMHTNRVNVTAKFKAGYSKNILHVFAGTNDLEAGTTGANLWANSLLPYIQAAITAGFTVVVGTIIPRSFSGSQATKDGERLAVNALITGNSATYGYTAADYGAIALLSNGSGTNNTASATYYVDGIHPFPAGELLIVAVGKPIIEALL